MKQVIKSRWEIDAYKLSMGQIFWLLFQFIWAKYVFVDRNNLPYIKGLAEEIKRQIVMFSELPAGIDRAQYVKKIWPWMNWKFLEWYANHKFDPNQVHVDVVDGKLRIFVQGPIFEVTYWEIILLRIVSSVYTELSGRIPNPNYVEEAEIRSRFFFDYGIPWVEGGGRRTFSPTVHWNTLAAATKYLQQNKTGGGLLGTSWVEYAFQLGLMQFGTQAHEFTGFTGAYFGYENANRKAMEIWVQAYGTKLGYVLPDSLTVNKFLEDFTFGYADLFTGSRHDSGPAIPYVEKMLAHYRSPLIDINPATKYIVHSNSIASFDEARALNEYKQKEYLRSLLIGGWHTNNVGYPPYNTVIKLWQIFFDDQTRFAVKIPDDIRKAVGDPQTVTQVIKDLNLQV